MCNGAMVQVDHKLKSNLALKRLKPCEINKMLKNICLYLGIFPNIKIPEIEKIATFGANLNPQSKIYFFYFNIPTDMVLTFFKMAS